MKILIIGATGGTGKKLVEQALEQQHEVTVLVRNPAKLTMRHPNLKLVKGDVLKPESLPPAFKEQEAVLSALGHKKWIIKSSILSKGTGNTIDEMRQQGIERFICITSLGVNDSRFKLGLYYTFFVIPFILLFYFLDKEKQERLIKESNLKWTIIRPGQLTNAKRKGRYKHGEKLGSYLLTKMISRADVAHFMLEQIKNDQYLYKTPGITY